MPASLGLLSDQCVTIRMGRRETATSLALEFVSLHKTVTDLNPEP